MALWGSGRTDLNPKEPSGRRDVSPSTNPDHHPEITVRRGRRAGR